MNTNRSKQKRKDGTKEEPLHLRERIDRFFSKLERFRGNWALIITLIAVALFLAARSYYDGNDKTVQLKFVEDPAAQSIDSGTSAVEPSTFPLYADSECAFPVGSANSHSGAMYNSILSFKPFKKVGFDS